MEISPFSRRIAFSDQKFESTFHNNNFSEPAIVDSGANHYESGVSSFDQLTPAKHTHKLGELDPLAAILKYQTEQERLIRGLLAFTLRQSCL
jgi:hypothetical protein